MKIKYDNNLDILHIKFSESLVFESSEDKNGIIIDYDAQGNVIGIEILSASKQMPNPKIVEYELV